MPYEQELIDKPYQIICEGADDCGFFSRLIRDRSIPDIQVGAGRGKDRRCLGDSGFSIRLQAIDDFSQVLNKGIIIVADCDDKPIEKFRFACNCLRQHKLAVPSASLEIAVTRDGRKSSVIMIPAGGEDGGLETLLLACCDGVTTNRGCVDAFCACIPEAPRKIDRDKLRLRSLIAATHPEDPGLALTSWLSTDNRPFAMTHPALDSLESFLLQFIAP
jgi:hypothetical protein